MRSSPSDGAGAGDLRGRRRRRGDYTMTMARFTIYVMLLGVKVVSLPAPGLHPDYGQNHNLCNALRC